MKSFYIKIEKWYMRKISWLFVRLIGFNKEEWEEYVELKYFKHGKK
mgnify:CR=1 FL=1